jgi:CxxC-x17-CxxC domain-containing protein
MTHYLIEFRFFGTAKYEFKRLIREVNRIFRVRSHRPVPHISLAGPFPTRDEKRLISDFEELCAKQPIMTFNVKGFGTFEENRVVYIKIEPDKNLDTFRWELSNRLRAYCNLRPYDREREFIFHSTIAMKLGQDKFDKVKKYIETKPEPEFTHCVMRVTLIKNSKILREYDFFLRRPLSRWEAKSRSILSESYKRLEKFREKLGHTEEVRHPEKERRHIKEVNVGDILKKGTSKIFLISDLHLDHANIIKFCNRPFKSLSEMNDFIVETWNKTVRKDDIVFFLGDMACGWGSRKTRFWLEKLNGNIFFVKGAHDKSRHIKFYGKLILNYKGHRFLLIHNPQDAPHDWEDWVIHGHTHNKNPEYPLVNKNKKTINVSVELIGYKPISLKELLAKLGPLPKHIENTCFYCGKIIRELPFRCHRCGENFCSGHHIPEVHECKELPKPNWDEYREEQERREPRPVRTPPIWVPQPVPPRKMYKVICADCGKETEVPFRPIYGRPVYCEECYQKRRLPRHVEPIQEPSTSPPPREKTSRLPSAKTLALISIALCGLAVGLVYMNYYLTTSSGQQPPLLTTPSLPPNSGVSPVQGSSPTGQVLPSGYYTTARETYGGSSSRNIQSLYNILMSESCKMPSYQLNTFDCSVASARLEWVLEGYGFHARLYMSSLFSHTWVMAELDDGSWVAIESTLLTSGNYSPPAIIEGPNGEYREYSYLYQMYQDYLQQYGNGGYILPNSYDDFVHNYLQWPAYNPLAGFNYYSGTEFYESPEDAVHGNGLYYYSITEFAWWNAAPYNSMAPFNGWD